VAARKVRPANSSRGGRMPASNGAWVAANSPKEISQIRLWCIATDPRTGRLAHCLVLHVLLSPGPTKSACNCLGSVEI
jgi:hypothetical protein